MVSHKEDMGHQEASSTPRKVDNTHHNKAIRHSSVLTRRFEAGTGVTRGEVISGDMGGYLMFSVGE